MTRTTTYPRPETSVAAPLLSFRGWFGRRLFRGRRGTPVIDPDALPEALRRDLGFADGRGASRRNPRWD